MPVKEISVEGSDEEPNKSLGGFHEALLEAPPIISELVPELMGDRVWVYNSPIGVRLLSWDSKGLWTTGEAVKANISPGKPFWRGSVSGLMLSAETLWGDDVLLVSHLLVEKVSSPDNSRILNNIWGYTEKDGEELQSGKIPLSAGEDEVVIIPVGSRKKNGGGVMVTKRGVLDVPHNRRLIEALLRSKLA